MNKETFLELLTNHTPEEINEIIREKGKLKLMNGLIFKEESNEELCTNNEFSDPKR